MGMRSSVGCVQVARKLYVSAAAKLEAVLKMEPNNEPAQRTLGLTLYALGTLNRGPNNAEDRRFLQVVPTDTRSLSRDS
jgi:hypothetical protein